MVWPGNLVSVTLMNAMYEYNDKKDPTVFGGTIARYRWFGYICAGAFVYFFIPGFLAQFLSVFPFPTWIAHNSPVVNQIFGGSTGLSLIPITFDWTQISGFVGNPLIPPLVCHQKHLDRCRCLLHYWCLGIALYRHMERGVLTHE